MAGYHVVSKAEAASVKGIDGDIKNKFKFEWLEVEVEVKVDGKDCKVKIGDSIVKINRSGIASCEWCQKLLTYRGKGLSTLKDHLKTDKHINQLKTRQSNYSLGSFIVPTSTAKVFPIFSRALSNSKPADDITPVQEDGQPTPVSKPKPLAMVPVADRVATMEAMILSVMTEHAIPLNFAPVIVDLAKACSSDPQALSGVNLGYTAAAYKIRFGLAKTVTKRLADDLKVSPFSLNIDEATCANTKKVLSVLVSYLKNGRIVTHHLASVEISKADSATIYTAICDIFTENELPWENLVSVLSDSCAVMRGHISGVETKIREEKATHLLDIDGDTCHHMQIIAKKFCAPFRGKLEKLFYNLHTDFKWCSEYKIYFSEICTILKIPYMMPQMCSGTRWLSSYDRAIETTELMDAFLLFYFSFLSERDRDVYRPNMKSVLQQHEVEVESRKRLYNIMKALSEKKSTKEGKQRKESILDALFYTSEDTMLQLQVYTSVLSIFKEYVCVFQTQSPMAHKLHDFQVAAVRKFLSCFMRPEHMPAKITEAKINDKSFHLPHADIYIGQSAGKVPTELMEKVVEGYMSAAQSMFDKLPIYNKTLMSLSALDPVLTSHTVVMKKLNKLGRLLKHLLSDKETISFSEEVRAYVNDENLPPTMENVDEWWCQKALCNKYPTLCKVALAALTVFHGPIVESTFSEMSRILNKQTNRLSIPMLSAIQTMKYELKSNKCAALAYFKRSNPKTDPICPLLCRNIRSAYTCYKNEMAQQKKAVEMKRKVLQRAHSARSAIATSAAIRKTALKKTKKAHLNTHILNMSAKYRKRPSASKKK